jgi:hypothetical protein
LTRTAGRLVLRILLIATGIGVAWPVSPVLAADVRFERVLLLTSGDRVSVVFELTGEPGEVSTRRVSAAVLELDAGPATMTADAESFAAPPGIRFVSGVSIRRGPATAAGGVLAARITLLERSRSTVRVVGRRVYVDFSPDAAPPRAARPAPATPRPPEPKPAPKPEPVPPAPPYAVAVRPAIEQLDRLAPFLVSATDAPSPPVLAAIGNTLTTIRRSVGSIDVPEESRETHGLLSSAIALAAAAVDPEFGGDRAAQTRQALMLLNRAKAAL